MIIDGMLRNLDNVSDKFLMYPRLSIKRGSDSLVRATTTASSLKAERDSGNIDKTQTKATSNELSSQGTSSGDGPRSQDTIGDTSAHTRYERVSKMSTDSLLAGVNTPRSDRDSLKHIELMKICTTLQKKVLDLEDALKRTKTAQQTKIDDVEEEEVVEVVIIAKMLIDTVVDDAQVTTAIVDILVSVVETIVTTAPTITAESTKTNVEVTQGSKRKRVMIQELKETITTTTKTVSSQQPQIRLSIKRGSDSLVRATTTASSLKAERDSGDGPRSQDTIGDTSVHTRYERVSKMSMDSLLAGVNTPRSDRDSLKHIELMKICTTLQKKVLDLEDALKRTKTAQQTKIDGLERRVKKLEKKHMSRTHKLKRLYKVGLTAREEEVVEVVITAKMLIDTVVDAAQVTTAIVDIPGSKRKRVMIQEPKETTTTKIVSSQQPQDDIQAKINADAQLAQRLHEEEQLQFTDAEKAKLFMEFMEKGKKFFAAKRDKEKRNKPPTKAQQRNKVETAQESSSKRERDELEQERSKKQKMDDDKESKDLRSVWKFYQMMEMM
uniref:Uncharacterized protein n=1 Tax=Tanacetum cinerariifolium TaxID=118510 RepID=A0A6L2MS77_TANCI|nr:hypothetical protein [Tanacetum cinerariifolium]